MKLLDIRWSDYSNVMDIACVCGNEFSAFMNRWWILCPKCGNREHINDVRGQRYWEVDKGTHS